MGKSELDESTLLSSLLSSGLCIQSPQVDQMGMKGGGRRRRRKGKEGEQGGAGDQAKKRRLSDEQVKFLEMSFGRERKLESGRKAHLATELGLDPKQVAVWFQNRRARWKSKQMEDEFSRLRSMHDAVLLQKCHLEAEVLKLKEQLSEAEKEIRKLSSVSCCERRRRSSSPTSCSSFSMEVADHHHQPLLQGLVGEEDHLTYLQNDYNSYINMMDWMTGHLFM